MQENKPEDTKKAPASPVVPKLENIPARVEHPLDPATIGTAFVQKHDDCDADDEAESSHSGEHTQLATQPPSPTVAHTQIHENETHSLLWHKLAAAGIINPSEY